MAELKAARTQQRVSQRLPGLFFFAFSEVRSHNHRAARADTCSGGQQEEATGHAILMAASPVSPMVCPIKKPSMIG